MTSDYRTVLVTMTRDGEVELPPSRAVVASRRANLSVPPAFDCARGLSVAPVMSGSLKMAVLALIFLCGGPGLGLGASRAHAALDTDDDLDAGALAPGSERSPFPELEMDGVHAPPEYVALRTFNCDPSPPPSHRPRGPRDACTV